MAAGLTAVCPPKNTPAALKHLGYSMRCYWMSAGAACFYVRDEAARALRAADRFD